MARLNWEGVQAPDFSAAMRGLELASNQIKGAFGGVREELNTVDNRMDERVNRQVLMDLTKYQDAEQAKADLVSGAIFDRLGPEARLRASAATIRAASDRPTEILRQVTAEQGVEEGKLRLQDLAGQVPFNEMTRKRTQKEWAGEDASAPIYKELIGAKSLEERNAILAKYPDVVSQLSPKQIEDLRRFGYTSATEGLDFQSKQLGVEGQQISNAGGRLGNTRAAWGHQRDVENYQEERAVASAAGKYMNFVGDTETLSRTILNDSSIPQHLRLRLYNDVATKLQLKPMQIEEGPADQSITVGGETTGGGMFGANWNMGQTPGADRPGGRKHAGWDLNGLTVGTPVALPKSGTVVRVRGKEDGNGAGNRMTVRYDDGTEHTFMHLDKFHKGFLKPGSRFNAGAVVAWAGNTGNASTRGTNQAVLHVEGSAGDPRRFATAPTRQGGRQTNVAEFQTREATAAPVLTKALQNNPAARLEANWNKNWENKEIPEIAADLAQGKLKGMDQKTIEGMIGQLMVSKDGKTRVSPWKAAAALVANTGARELGIWGRDIRKGLWTPQYAPNVNVDGARDLIANTEGTQGARTSRSLFTFQAAKAKVDTTRASMTTAETQLRAAQRRKLAQPGYDVGPFQRAYDVAKLRYGAAVSKLETVANGASGN